MSSWATKGRFTARVGKAKLDPKAAAVERFRLVAVKLTGDGEDLATFAVDGQDHRVTPQEAQDIVARVEVHAARIARNVLAMRKAAEALKPFMAKASKAKTAKREQI